MGEREKKDVQGYQPHQAFVTVIAAKSIRGGDGELFLFLSLPIYLFFTTYLICMNKENYMSKEKQRQMHILKRLKGREEKKVTQGI